MTDSNDDEKGHSESLPKLFWDGVKIAGTALLAAAGIYGTPISNVLKEHALTAVFGFALAASFYVIWRRSAKRTNADGLADALPERAHSTETIVLKALRRAKKVDMLGFNLRSAGLKRSSKFDDLMTRRLQAETDLKLRIIIADPECASLARRDAQESGTDTVTGRMKAEVNDVQNYLSTLRSRTGRSDIKVKLVDADLIRCSLIIADETMLATWYLSYRRGSQSPTLEIRGTDSAFFALFQDEFESVWKKGRAMGDT